MKRIILIISLVSFGFLAMSQNCEAYIPTTVGSKVTTKNYNKKDKLSSTVTTEVLSVEMVDGKQQVVVSSESIETDGTSSGKSEVTYYCDGDNFEVDLTSMLDQNKMPTSENMTVEYTMENLKYPAIMTEGMSLADGFVEAEISNEGMAFVMRLDVKDSKVEAIESITVPAGTYDAAKISQTLVSKTGFMTFEMKSIQWMVKDIGAVRTETYSKKGKLIGYSVITSIE